MTNTITTTGEMITPPTEMTYQDRLIIKNTCDKIIRCMSQFSKYTKKDGLCVVYPNVRNESFKGSIITVSHYKDDRPCEENTSWGFPVSRFTKTNNIYNAVYACKLFYEHFNRGEVAEMLLEEYRKEPLFMKEVA